MGRPLDEPRGINWQRPTGREVVWSWIIGALIAWLAGTSAVSFYIFDEGELVGSTLSVVFGVPALAGIVVPTVLTHRWWRSRHGS